jgi:hypothetical protein
MLRLADAAPITRTKILAGALVHTGDVSPRTERPLDQGTVDRGWVPGVRGANVLNARR